MNNSILSSEVLSGIDHWLDKFPADKRQSAVIPALSIAQKDNGGWLTEKIMDAIAEYIGISKIAVYEVATFYSLYDLKQVGRYKLFVCTNISCMLNGSSEILQHLQQKLAIAKNETTADSLFTLKEVECLGACAGAPAIQINDDYHENLTIAKLDKVLQDLATDKDTQHGSS